MFKSFFLSSKWTLYAYGLGLILILSVVAQVQLTVQINTWYGGFYDILQKVEQHTIQEFWQSIIQFCKIAFPFVLLISVSKYLTRIYALKWREAMMFHYLPQWKQSFKNIEGSSQRLQEDTYRFAKIVENLGLSVINAILTLISFIPILWHIGKGINVPIFGTQEGNLVFLALVVSIGGLIISWFVGWFLPGLEYNNQKVEASLRKELVLAENERHNYAQTDTIISLFTGIKFNYNKLFLHYGYFDLWSNTFDQILVIVPYIIVAPNLFSGMITLGIVIQVANAFGKVRESFSVFVNDWTTVNELRSIYKRLKEFEDSL